MNTQDKKLVKSPLNTLEATLRNSFNDGPFGREGIISNIYEGNIVDLERWMKPVDRFRSAYAPRAETYREAEDFIIKLDLPGVNVDDDVTVELSDHKLVITGERHDVKEESHTGVFREVTYGSFSRSFSLPQNIEAKNISATTKDGVLTVRVINAFISPASEAIMINITAAEKSKGNSKAEAKAKTDKN